MTSRRAYGGQARGIAGRLRGHAVERGEHRLRQRGEARIAGRGFFGQPGVDEIERNVARDGTRRRDWARPPFPSAGRRADGSARGTRRWRRARRRAARPAARSRRTARARLRARSPSCASAGSSRRAVRARRDRATAPPRAFLPATPRGSRSRRRAGRAHRCGSGRSARRCAGDSRVRAVRATTAAAARAAGPATTTACRDGVPSDVSARGSAARRLPQQLPAEIHDVGQRRNAAVAAGIARVGAGTGHAGQARIGGREDRHGRRAQRCREVRQPGVDADHDFGVSRRASPIPAASAVAAPPRLRMPSAMRMAARMLARRCPTAAA